MSRPQHTLVRLIPMALARTVTIWVSLFDMLQRVNFSGCIVSLKYFDTSAIILLYLEDMQTQIVCSILGVFGLFLCFFGHRCFKFGKLVSYNKI